MGMRTGSPNTAAVEENINVTGYSVNGVVATLAFILSSFNAYLARLVYRRAGLGEEAGVDKTPGQP